jgi:metal-responsive CopG/Arc/MetJ family transcriptional regulator
MATVNYSVPDDVKDAFNEAYKGQNKSAVITELMREAVERAARKQRHRDACANILAMREQMYPVSAEEVQSAAARRCLSLFSSAAPRHKSL